MIEISARALEKLRAIHAAAGSASGLRLFLEKEPRGGTSLGFLLDEPRPGDAIVSFEGFSVFIDPHSRARLEGARLDLETGPQGVRFVAITPGGDRL